mmetsp:Transcript_28692/g.48154  ORF Transcript_28692/g.48154 Transcript_28692/m.48154 type:complete len:94 (+) Transcript_28692:545-826(+)
MRDEKKAAHLSSFVCLALSVDSSSCCRAAEAEAGAEEDEEEEEEEEEDGEEEINTSKGEVESPPRAFSLTNNTIDIICSTLGFVATTGNPGHK